MALDLITTTAGRAAILNAILNTENLTVEDVQLSDTDQSVDVSTTSLSSVVATLTSVTGSVRPAGDGNALHVVITDDSSAAYDVRALALRLSDGTFLMVYSQAGLIASKAADSTLLLAFDLSIDGDTAAVIDFGGTDFALPMASESAPGIVELATRAEVAAGTDTVRAVTPREMWRQMAAVRSQSVELSFLSTLQSRFTDSDITGACSTPPGAASPIIVVCRDDTVDQIYTSTDGGFNFAAKSLGSSSTAGLQAVAYGGPVGTKRFVAVGEDIQVSADADTWTRAGASVDYRDVIWSEALQKWIVVGSAGEIAISDDGTLYSGRTAGSGYTGTFNSLCEHEGRVFLCGSGGEIQVTSNGTTFTRLVGGGSLNLVRIQSTPFGILALSDSGSSTNNAYLSTDGGETFQLVSLSALIAVASARISRSGVATTGAVLGDGWNVFVPPFEDAGRFITDAGDEGSQLVRTDAAWVGWLTTGEVFVSLPIPLTT